MKIINLINSLKELNEVYKRHRELYFQLRDAAEKMEKLMEFIFRGSGGYVMGEKNFEQPVTIKVYYFDDIVVPETVELRKIVLRTDEIDLVHDRGEYRIVLSYPSGHGLLTLMENIDLIIEAVNEIKRKLEEEEENAKNRIFLMKEVCETIKEILDNSIEKIKTNI